MPETVCVTVEQLRKIEWSGRPVPDYHPAGIGEKRSCPACRAIKSDEWRSKHFIECWIGNAIAQAERLKDWTPNVGDEVRLKATPEFGVFWVRGVNGDDVYIYRAIGGVWRHRAELMPAEEENAKP